MKILTIVAFVFVISSLAGLGQGVFLQTGESYVFEFDSIPYTQSGLLQNEVIAWFAPNTYSGTALLQIYANSLSDTPLSASTNIVINEYSSGRTGIPYYWPLFTGTNTTTPYFQDLQGVLKVTMLSGSAELSGFDVSQVFSGDLYSGYFPVPEPSGGALLTTGLGCLFLTRKFQGKLPKAALEPTADSACSSASRATPRVGGGSAFVR